MAAVPPWFAGEVLRHLPGAIPGKDPGQYYARCPVPRHADRHRSFAICPGDSIPVVFCCHGGCTDAEARAALIGIGIPEDYLGPYGTPEYEARRQSRAASDERRIIERLRWEMLEFKATIRGLLSAELSLALLKIRIFAAVEGVDVPTGRKEYIPFAIRAGVSQPRAYAAWNVDPLIHGQERSISDDNAVLARADQNGQAPQVSGHDAIIEARNPFSDREGSNAPDSRNDNSRNEKSETDAAIEALRSAGLTKPAA